MKHNFHSFPMRRNRREAIQRHWNTWVSQETQTYYLLKHAHPFVHHSVLHSATLFPLYVILYVQYIQTLFWRIWCPFFFFFLGGMTIEPNFYLSPVKRESVWKKLGIKALQLQCTFWGSDKSRTIYILMMCANMKMWSYLTQKVLNMITNTGTLFSLTFILSSFSFS